MGHTAAKVELNLWPLPIDGNQLSNLRFSKCIGNGIMRAFDMVRHSSWLEMLFVKRTGRLTFDIVVSENEIHETNSRGFPEMEKCSCDRGMIKN
jgi:hypothetical protein